MFPDYTLHLGPPVYGVRKGTVGVCFHTTEAPGQTVADAISTARWQSTDGNSKGGSYNFILGRDGAILTVPFLDIAGGINPTQNRHNRSTFPFLPGLIGEAAFRDPNAYLLQVALSGRTADFMANGYPAGMVDQAARIVLWAERSSWGADNLALVAHYQFSTQRSDPGTKFIQLVLDRYAQLVAEPAPAPEPPADYAGTPTVWGTRYPSYVHTAEQALAWVNRKVRELYL